MDFRVIIRFAEVSKHAIHDTGKEIGIFEQYKDMLAFVDQTLAHWNNFDSHNIISIDFEKVPNKTDTIAVNATDNFNLSERIS